MWQPWQSLIWVQCTTISGTPVLYLFFYFLYFLYGMQSFTGRSEEMFVDVSDRSDGSSQKGHREQMGIIVFHVTIHIKLR